MKKVIFLFAVLITLITWQCQKASQESLLPPVSAHGANTFGCLVNGNAWLPKGGWGTVTALNVEFGVPGSDLLIIARHPDGNNSGVDFDVRNISGSGIYNITNRLRGWMDYSEGNSDYSDDSTGVLRINYIDTVNKIISGTFHFHPNPDDITAGRFDVHYPLTIH